MRISPPRKKVIYPIGTTKCAQQGFRYGKSEYEASFGVVTRNGDIYPSDPKTREPCNSPLRNMDPVRSSDSNAPQKLGVSGSKPSSLDIYTPKYKNDCQICVCYFLKIESDEIHMLCFACQVFDLRSMF